MNLTDLKSRIKAEPITGEWLLMDDECPFPPTGYKVQEADLQDYTKSLMLLDECNTLLVEFEFVKLSKDLRDKLIYLRKQLSEFMTYDQTSRTTDDEEGDF